MKLSLRCLGEPIAFECSDNKLSEMIAVGILTGETYPPVRIVGGVATVLDIGANIGAVTLFLSMLYPDATVHAFEPAQEPFDLLVRNTSRRPNVRCHNFGLFTTECRLPLYQGALDSVTASVARSALNNAESEPVVLRSTSEWLTENSIRQIDVLKIDTEGCEVPILTGMQHWLADVSLIYVEYHSEGDRRAIDRLLGDTHLLVRGRIEHAHRGELTYVAQSIFAADPALGQYEITMIDDRAGTFRS